MNNLNLLKFKSNCIHCDLPPIGYIICHGLNNECITLGDNRRDRTYWPSDNLEYLEYKYEQSIK